jgi:hypothetical protein
MSMIDDFPQPPNPTPEEAAQRAFEDEDRGVPREVLRDLGEPDLDEVAQESLGGLHTRETTTSRFQHDRQIVRGRPHAPPVSREDIEARKAELLDENVPATKKTQTRRQRNLPPDSHIGSLIAQTRRHLKDSVPLTDDEKAELKIYLREENPDSVTPRPAPPVPPTPPKIPPTE